jgi:hypothetical protein
LVLSLAACGQLADPQDNTPPEGTPRQFMLVQDPEVTFPTLPLLRPDSDVVVFILTVADSTPHRGWWPTRLQVESDRGFSAELLVAPNTCLDSITTGPRAALEWPLNFDWWGCDRIGVVNTTLLTMSQVRQMEDRMQGRLMWLYPFKTMPGGQYEFRVSVGRSAIEQAMTATEALPFIQGEVYHPTKEPLCVISDDVPPPPCPPWLMARHEYFTFSDTPGDSIPVSHGGWIRATYTQADGTRRVGVLEFP